MPISTDHWKQWGLSGLSNMDKWKSIMVLQKAAIMMLALENERSLQTKLLTVAKPGTFIPVTRNNTRAVFIASSGGVLQEFACPVWEYDVANVSYCSKDLAIIKDGDIAFVRYPEMVLSDTPRYEACSDRVEEQWKCPEYPIVQGTVQQCPYTFLVDINNVKELGYVSSVEETTRNLNRWVYYALQNI